MRLGDIDVSQWRHYLDGVAAGHALPLDHASSLHAASSSEFVEDVVDAQGLSLLRAACAASDVPLLAGLHAAYAALVARYCGESDVVIAVRDHGCRTGLATTKDVCNSVLLLRTEVDQNLPFASLLQRSQAELLKARTRGEISVAALFEALQRDGDSEPPALMQVVLELEIPAAENDFRSFAHPHLQAGTDLQLRVIDGGDTLQLRWEYPLASFERETIARMSAHFKVLMQAGCTSTSSKLCELPLLTGEELSLLEAGWRRSSRPFASDIGIHRLFEEQVLRTPDAIALIDDDDRSLTYSELDTLANRLAHRLIYAGAESGSFVGVGMTRSLQMIVAIYGILKAGCAYVPLEPDYPDSRLSHMIRDSGLRTVCTQKQHAERFSGHELVIIELDDAFECRLDSQSAERAQHSAPIDWGRLPAYMIYTSGTTGTPKGVVVEHAPLVNRIVWMQSTFAVDASDRVLQKTPFSFDVSVWEFFWPLIAGATLVVARPDGHKDPEYLQRIIVRRGLTVLHFVPSMLAAMLDGADLGACPSLRYVICSGEALSLPLQKSFFASGTAAELHNLYGPTEATVDVTHWHCQPDSPLSCVPIGYAIDNVRLYVLDRHRNLQPAGVLGELYIGGQALARGYHNLPELTAASFLPDVFSDQPHARMYKTGDLVKTSLDGRIDYLGRTDEQVKIRGFRIELQKIISVLEADPTVSASIVLKHGESLVAFVKLQHGALGGIDATRYFRDLLARQLPAFMVPNRFIFVEHFPMSHNGKVARRELARLDPELSTALPQPPLSAADPLRDRLADLWGRVLRIPAANISDDANFFELGGDSLQVLELVGKARQLGMAINLSEFAKSPRFSALLAQLGGEGATQTHVDRSRTVELLRDIWADVLGLDRTMVDDDRSFFELGGDSLLMLRLIAKAKRQNIPLDVRTFSASPYLSSAVRQAQTLQEQLVAPVPVARTPAMTLANFDEDLILQRSRSQVNHATPFQQGLLAYSAAQGSDSRYVVQWKLPITGAVDFARFEESCRILAARTELLRSRFEFAQSHKGYVRVLLPDHRPVCRHVDLSAQSNESAARALQDYLRQDKRDGFDVSAGALIRFALIARGAEACELLVTVHHAIMDGYSAGLIIEQLSAIYAGLSNGELVSDYPDAEAQFSAYEQWLSRQDVVEVKRYWSTRLAGAEPTLLALNPARRAADGPERFAEVRRRMAIGEDARSVLKREGVTLSAMLNTLTGLLLARFHGSTAFTWGNAVSHRPEDLKNVDRIIGACLGTIPVVADFSGPESLLELCRQTQVQVLQSRERSFISLGDIFAAAGGRNLFNVLFSFQNYRANASTSGSFDLDSRAAISAHFPLTVVVSDRGDGLDFQVSFSDQVISESQVNAILVRLELLLGRLPAVLELPCDRIDIHEGLAESMAGSASGNELDAVAAEGPGLVWQFQHAVDAFADRVALLDSEGRQISYAQLGGMVNHLAGLLAAMPATGTVGICVDRSYRMVVAVLAAIVSGRSFVSLEKDFPDEKIRWITQSLGVELLITDQVSHLLDGAENVSVLRLSDPLASAELPVAGDFDQPTRICCINYTSGSTGQPKLVVTDQASHLNRLGWLRTNFPASAQDVFCLKTRLAFAPAMREILEPLTQGAALYVLPERANQSLEEFTAEIEKHRVTRVFITPSFLRTILETGMIERLRWTQLLEISGEPLPSELVSRLRRHLPATRLLNRYGATEAASVVYSELDEADRAYTIAPLGRPIANTSIFVVDDHQRVLPRNVVGEILISSLSLARGYNDARQDEGSFVPFPVNGRSHAFRTGDLGYLDESGRLFYIGRRSRMLKVRGFRIEPAEIELALEAHDSVQRAHVIALASERGSRVIACWTAHPGRSSTTTDAQLRDFLSETLPSYMLPASFIRLEQMPVTSSGKVDFVELARIAESLPTQSSAPRDAVEHYLVELLCSRLQLSNVGVDEDLFNSGVDSLAALQLIHAVNETYSLNLSITALYQRATVRSFAEFIRARVARPADAIGGNYLTINPRPGNERVFMFPPAGGGPFIYISLEGKLPPHITVVAFESPLHEKPDVLPGEISLHGIAHSYLEQIDQIRQDGPIHLCGYSLGGTIAYEVACLLARRGETVASLVLIDPGFSHSTYDDALDEQTLARIVSAQLGEGSRDATELSRSVKRLHRDSQLIRSFRPGHYDGDVTLIKPESVAENERNYDRPMNGIEGLVRGTISVVRVPGNHMTMMTRHSAEIAAALGNALVMTRRAVQEPGGTLVGESA